MLNQFLMQLRYIASVATGDVARWVLPGLFQVNVVAANGGALADGATIAVDNTLGNFFTLTCASNAARAIQPPTAATPGAEVAIRLVNTSGGALTLTTFAAGIKQPAVVLPANNQTRYYTLTCYVAGTWALTAQSAADIPV